MPDQRWDELFGAMTSDRDRAILALAVSSAARAGELIQLRGGDVDWGEQLIRVRRKGSDAEQWLAASRDAFVWLRLYLADLPALAANDPLWWTLRQRGGVPGGRVPLTYDALRAVLRRANDHLGANWTMHDLRHTCALRMTRAEGLSLRDVQTVLGNAHLSTTQIYLVDDDAEVIARVRQHLVAGTQRTTRPPSPPLADGGYRADDLAVLFGSPRQ
jgi:integrase/recombinase XerD